MINNLNMKEITITKLIILTSAFIILFGNQDATLATPRSIDLRVYLSESGSGIR